jgi:hypothetical protein
MQNPQQTDEFSGLNSPAEVLLVAYHLEGPEVAKLLLGIDPERRSLQRAAAELKAGRAPSDLISLVKSAARAAPKSMRRTFVDQVKRRQRREP